MAEGLLDLEKLMAQFGATEQDRRDANKQAAFALGFGLLQGRKGNELPTIGQAGMGALAVRQKYLNDIPQQRMESVQAAMGAIRTQQELQAMQAAQEQRQKLTELTQRSTVAGLPPMGPPSPNGQMQPEVPPSFDKQKFGAGLWAIDPAKAMAFESAQAKESPFAKIDPSKFTPESIARYVRSNNPGDLQSVEAQTVGKLNPSDFTPASVATYMRSNNYADLVPIDKRPVSNVNIRNVGETEYDKTMGKASADAFVAYQAAGRNADATIGRLNAIDQMLKNIDTNTLTPIGMKISGTARAAGITLDPNLPQKQAAEALANEMALASRQGGQMPGAMSDKDREFLQAMNPNLAQTPEGRSLLVATRKKTAQREKEVAKMARDYAGHHGGRLDSGFDDELSNFVNTNPLFSSEPAKSGSALTAVEEQELRQLRKRFGK